MSTVTFDATFYLEQNPDVAAAVEAGIYPDAFAHFQQFGQFELRDPNAFFDTTFYLVNNVDVLRALIRGEVASAFDHFVAYGQFEGAVRAPSAEFTSFDEEAYLAANPDVAAAVADGTYSNGFQHFLTWGVNENRPGAPNFEPGQDALSEALANLQAAEQARAEFLEETSREEVADNLAVAQAALAADRAANGSEATLEARLNLAEATLADVEATIGDVEGLEEAVAELDEAEAQLEAAQAAVASAETALSDAQGELATAQTAVEEAEAGNDAAQTALSNATQAQLDAAAAVTAAQGNVDSAQIALGSANQAAETAQLDFDASLETLSTLKNIRDGEIAGAVSALTAFADAQGITDTPIPVYDGVDEDGDDILVSITVGPNLSVALQDGTVTLNNQTVIERNADGEAVVTGAGVNVPGIDTFVVALNDLIDALDAVTEQQGVRDELEIELFNANAAVDAAEEALTEAQGELTEAQGALETANTALETAQGDAEEAETALTEAQEVLTAAQGALETANTALATAQDDAEAAATALADAQAELTAAETAVADAQTALEAAQTAEGEAEAARDEAQAAVDALDPDGAYADLISAREGVEAAEAAIDNRNDLIADVADAQQAADALTALDADVNAALEALDELGFEAPQIVEGEPEVGTDGNDLFVFTGESGTIDGFGAEGEDALFIGTNFSAVALGDDASIGSSQGSVSALEVFIQQQGEDTILYFENETFSGNATGLGDQRFDVVTLTGVDAADVSVDANGFLRLTPSEQEGAGV